MTALEELARAGFVHEAIAEGLLQRDGELLVLSSHLEPARQYLVEVKVYDVTENDSQPIMTSTPAAKPMMVQTPAPQFPKAEGPQLPDDEVEGLTEDD